MLAQPVKNKNPKDPFCHGRITKRILQAECECPAQKFGTASHVQDSLRRAKKKKSPSYYPWMENEPIKVCACVRENFSKWQCGVKTRGTIPCPLSNGSA